MDVAWSNCLTNVLNINKKGPELVVKNTLVHHCRVFGSNNPARCPRPVV